MVILGEKEQSAGSLSLRKRSGEQILGMNVDDLASLVADVERSERGERKRP